MQTALRRSPGQFSAVQVWLAQPGVDSHAVQAAAAQAEDVGSARVTNARVLVALGPAQVGAEEPGILPRNSGGRWLPPSRGDLFVQVTADNHEGLHLALRHTSATCAGIFRLSEEITGGRLGQGREPFGFHDGVVHPRSGDEVAEAVVIPRGKLAGGSWVLFLRMQQAIAQFHSLPCAEQERVIGREKTLQADELRPMPADAHVRRMRAANPGDRFPFVRRGFPFRAFGEEGLAFVAAGAEPEKFSRALDHFLGSKGPADALGQYAWAVSGGVFWAPPAEWLQQRQQQGRR